jgi:membrane protein DedA with SNARE-associated domain
MLERLVDMLAGHSLHVGYAFVLLVLVLCGFGFPLPEDVVLVTGGVLAWLDSPLHAVTFGKMIRDEGLLAMVVVGLVGILAGDSAIYLMGRRFGVRVAEIRPLRRIVTPEKLEQVEKKIRRYGNVVVMVARFLPGLRAPTFFTVGHARMPYWRFIAYDGAAALVSAPLWVMVGFYFGSDIQKAARFAKQFGHYLWLGALVVVAFLALRWWQARKTAQAAEAMPPGKPVRRFPGPHDERAP